MSGPSSPERVSFSFTLDNQDYSIVFDASINEQHGGQSEASSHPVERGPNITDNIRPLPQKLSLEVMVTNTPIYPDVLAPTKAAGGDVNATVDSQTFQVPNNDKRPIVTDRAKSLQFPEQFNRVKDVVEALTAAQRGGALIEVFTTLTTYENMVILNDVIPRNADNSNAVRITIDMQELILVDSLEVQTLAAKHQEKKRGQQPNKPPEPAKEEQLRSFAKGVGKLLFGAQ